MIGPDFHGGGHPWHGLCTDGELALPNATAKTYPQPSGGDCFKLAVPGFTPPVRTAAQQADDTAQGLQWLDHVLVSGDSSTVNGLQVYGKPLGKMKWIWAVSKSEKWLVDASALIVSGGTLTGNLTLTEFGLHNPNGAAAQTHSLAISAAAGVDAAVKLKIIDLSEDGANALIGLYAYADGLRGTAPMKPTPAAVVEFSLTPGDPPACAVSQVYADSDIALPPWPIGAVIEGAARPQFSIERQQISGGGYNVTYRVYLKKAGTTMSTLDVQSSVSAASTTPPNTTEYIQPTLGSVHLAGSAACPGGNTAYNYDFTADVVTMDEILAEAQAIQTARQAQVAAGQANIYKDEYVNSNCQPSSILLLADVFEGATNYSWTITLDETLHGTGINAYKTAYYAVIEQRDAYDFTYDTNGCLASAVFTGTVSRVYGGSADAVYFKKTTTGATGGISWSYWATQPSCSSPQYLLAPDLGTPGSSPVYSWAVTATITAIIDGVTTTLGVQSFSYLQDSNPGGLPWLYFVAELINQPDKGNADRVEFYFSHPYAPNPTTREAAVAEIVFTNPCVGVYGLALVNNLGGSAQPNYLHQLAKRDGSIQSWDGWSDYGPHETVASLQPVSMTLAHAGPTANPDPELPATPAAAVCFV